jgi:hypothetical protein
MHFFLVSGGDSDHLLVPDDCTLSSPCLGVYVTLINFNFVLINKVLSKIQRSSTSMK